MHVGQFEPQLNSRTLHFNFQDFPGPISLAWTFQVMEILEKYIKDFPELSRNRGNTPECTRLGFNCWPLQRHKYTRTVTRKMTENRINKNTVKVCRTFYPSEKLHSCKVIKPTSNVTGRHRGLKQKLRAGYRMASLHCMACRDQFSSSSVASSAFSALCVYSKFGHHPHPLGHLCAKFRFCCGLSW